MAMPELLDFRLVGRTSLALQIGHRTSIDIDLFTDKDFDVRSLQALLYKSFEKFQVVWQGKNGFSASINEVKTDFFNWHVPFADPSLEFDSLRLLRKNNIAAMKLDTITSRKDKKDFVDIHYLLKDFSLEDMISHFRRMYPFMDHKFVLESLSAISLADDTNEPLMMEPFDWIEAKEVITASVKDYVSRLTHRSASQQSERLKRAEELFRRKNKE